MLKGLERLQAVAEIDDLVQRYGDYVDMGDIDGFVNSFAPDGVFGTIAGHAALRAHREKGSGGIVRRHIFTPPIIAFTSATTASGRGFCLVIERHPDGREDPYYCVDYKDAYRKTDKGWKLQHRQVPRSFQEN